MSNSHESLASYRQCLGRLAAGWAAFQAKRSELLQPVERYGRGAEKLAEDIVRALLTIPLDWEDGELNPQLHHADFVVTHRKLPKLLIETKAPRSLAFSTKAINEALHQARGYADEQWVKTVAVSDGYIFYAADRLPRDVRNFRPRVCVDLTALEPSDDLWWVSVDGIDRDRPDPESAGLHLLGRPLMRDDDLSESPGDADEPLHPKYGIPARCFAYVPSLENPKTWSLPYRRIDGSVDTRRLPGAINAVVRRYRGTELTKVPEADVAGVLVRLGTAAVEIGKLTAEMPCTSSNTYDLLGAALHQVGKFDEVFQASLTIPTG